MYKLLVTIVLLSALVGCGQQTAQEQNPGESSNDLLVETPSSQMEQSSSVTSSIVQKTPDTPEELPSPVPSNVVQRVPNTSELISSVSSGVNAEIQDETAENINSDNEKFDIDNVILDLSQKKSDFTSYCNAHMDEDAYGGFSEKGDVVVLYYLDLEQVKAVAEQYEPDWNGPNFKYVDDPIQIEYQEAKYSITFLKQIKQEVYKEMQRQGIDDHPDARLGIHNNHITLSLFEKEIPEMEKYLKTYKYNYCISIHNMSAAPIPNT